VEFQILCVQQIPSIAGDLRVPSSLARASALAVEQRQSRAGTLSHHGFEGKPRHVDEPPAFQFERTPSLRPRPRAERVRVAGWSCLLLSGHCRPRTWIGLETRPWTSATVIPRYYSLRDSPPRIAPRDFVLRRSFNFFKQPRPFGAERKTYETVITENQSASALVCSSRLGDDKKVNC